MAMFCEFKRILQNFVFDVSVLVRKYSQVIQRYYVQYLSGFDAIALNQMMQNLSVCPEDESIILSSLCNNIANLSVKQGITNFKTVTAFSKRN